MPQAGDKLYRVWNATLEVVTFVKEDIAEGASVPTYVLRPKDRKRFRCSKDMYCVTEKEAWQRDMQYVLAALRELPKRVQELQDHVSLLTGCFFVSKEALEELS
jgi:hypothetical protein